MSRGSIGNILSSDIGYQKDNVFFLKENIVSQESDNDIREIQHKNDKLRKANRDLKREIEQMNAELIATSKALKDKQNELLSYKSELEKVSTDLFETNQALTVLARNIDKGKKKLEERVDQTVNNKVMPIIKSFQRKDKSNRPLLEIDVIAGYLESLTTNSSIDQNIHLSLSDTEMKIATMIKNGLSSKKISDMLYISLETVKTHRKNIRRKLNLQKSGMNLNSYLKSTI